MPVLHFPCCMSFKQIPPFFQMITTTPFIKYNQITTPFTKLHVSIRAFTYWGTSPQVQADVFSPPSTPSAPNNLRVFVTYLQQEGESQTINATFRWDPPLHSNGVIQGYKIFCWYEYDGADVHICENSSVQPKEKEYVVANLLRNQTYFFQVSESISIRGVWIIIFKILIDSCVCVHCYFCANEIVH